MPLRRTPLIAAAVALVAFLVLEVSLGAALAGTPDEWSVAPAQVGDQGRYSVVQIGPEIEPFVSDLRFERLAPQAAYAADGQPFVAHRMSESWTQTENSAQFPFWQISLDQEDGAGAVHSKVHQSSYSGWSSRGVAINIGISNNPPSQSVHTVTTLYDWDYGTCGLRSNLDANPPWLGGCPDGMQPLRIVDWDGEDVLVYGPESDPDAAQVWMHPDYPVPVQILQRRAPEVDNQSATYDVFRLAGFERGTDAAPTPPLPAPMPMGEPVPTMEGQPDPSGFPVEFPLEEALVGARSQFVDPQTEGVAEFLDRPDVYIRAASLEHHTEQDYIVRAWTIHATDGATELSLTVSRDDPAPGNPAPFDPIEFAAYGGRHAVDDVEFQSRKGPSIDQLPTHLPSVADAARAWLHDPPAGQSDTAPDAYAFHHDCADAECTEVESWVGAGPKTLVSLRSRYGNVAGISPFPEDGTFDVEGSLRKLDANGNLLGTDEWHQQGRRVSLGSLGHMSATGSGQPVSFQDKSWTPPSGPVTATAAGAAGALGLLVYVLIAARQGPLAGLFSRIEAPLLILHPVRAALVELVEAEPGIHFSALARRVAKPPGVVQHHIGKLVDGGILSRTTNGHTTSYFARGQVDHSLAETAPLLRREGVRRVLDAIRSGDATNAELVARTGFSQSTVSHHVRRLRNAGLLDTEKIGREVRLSVTELGQRAATLAA